MLAMGPSQGTRGREAGGVHLLHSSPEAGRRPSTEGKRTPTWSSSPAEPSSRMSGKHFKGYVGGDVGMYV